MIKINFRLQNYDAMMLRYKQLLTYIKSAVTRNHSEKSINSILVRKIIIRLCKHLLEMLKKTLEKIYSSVQNLYNTYSFNQSTLLRGNQLFGSIKHPRRCSVNFYLLTNYPDFCGRPLR